MNALLAELVEYDLDCHDRCPECHREKGDDLKLIHADECPWAWIREAAKVKP